MEEEVVHLPWVLGGHMMESQSDKRLEPAGPRRHCKDLGFQSECSGCLEGTRAEDICQLTYIFRGSLWPLS